MIVWCHFAEKEAAALHFYCVFTERCPQPCSIETWQGMVADISRNIYRQLCPGFVHYTIGLWSLCWTEIICFLDTTHKQNWKLRTTLACHCPKHPCSDPIIIKINVIVGKGGRNRLSGVLKFLIRKDSCLISATLMTHFSVNQPLSQSWSSCLSSGGHKAGH